MQKHRKKRHYKAMAIGAVTLGVVGIPVALAGLGTEEAGATPVAAQAAAPAAGTQEAAASAASATTAAERVVALVNKERAKVGCKAVKANKKLTTAALKHSKDMAAHRTMSHTGSDGSDPGQRITRAGYQWRTYGENVAYGYTTSTKVMKGWMNSPGHKRNILNCAFKEIGVARAQPGNYWTQVFATRR
ncbi:CAP domain-containing protein [Streptomyces bambusae]|uniref:CAP domain-containing protein n=1 Tax=Streptomyces bambusae TaxID=1550616 RepID=UPI001CFFF727|nr:CAP domain-containing protein [Streptomyces bambusae]MCB5169080.1 CAP domain-containing protein [Streptomyces bambusae]